MKKSISLFLLVVLLLLSACAPNADGEQNVSNDMEQSHNFILEPEKIISISYNQISIFEGDLKDTENCKYEKIDISIKKDVWKINGKEYISYQTVETIFKNNSRWKMDFSYMLPCCKSSDFVIYSNNGKSDNDVLLVEYSNVFFMLVHGDVLNPFNYTIQDFAVEWYKDDSALISNTNLESLWQSHLYNEKDINAVASDEAFPSIRFRVKEHPELVYTFPFTEINGEFYTPPVFRKS